MRKLFMSCVLHFTGDDVILDHLIAVCPVQPDTQFLKGEPRSSRPGARLNRTSGVAIVISDADFDDFEAQKSEALGFLTTHKVALEKLRALPGIDCASLDFGIAMRNVIVQSDGFGEELIAIIAQLRLGLVLSQYPVAKSYKRIKQYRRALRKHA
jgi:hypothetical protein